MKIVQKKKQNKWKKQNEKENRWENIAVKIKTGRKLQKDEKD